MKHKLLSLSLYFSVVLLQLLYAQSATLTTLSGATTICRGTQIQINLAVNPPRPSGATSQYNVQWNKDQGNPNIVNCSLPAPGGACSFIRFTPQITTIYSVVVNGLPSGPLFDDIEIIVEDVPDAGFDTTLFLCGKTGIINLFNELNGTPQMGGTWSNGTGTYDTSNPNGGVFTYTVAGGTACPPQSATVTVRPCNITDIDGDGVDDTTDQDKDNDGIPNLEEDSYCNGGIGSTTPIFILEEDFGFGGPTRSRYAVPDLTYNPGLPLDGGNGEYNVATSTFLLTALGGTVQTFLSTDLNRNVDANGDVNGRYMAINMNTAFFANKPIFEVRDLPVTPGLTYDFSMAIASLHNDPGVVRPDLTIEVVDQATNTVLFDSNSGPIPNGTDMWIPVTGNFIAPAGTTVVAIRVTSRQTMTGFGNDVGIDNIFLSTSACDFDRDGIPNSEDLDSDNDGIYDIVETGNAGADTNGDGRFDGAINATGSGTITPNLIDTDGDGTNDNYLDIDSDNDGIVDNIEGQTTLGYVAPSGIDGDFNGVDDVYDLNGTPVVPVDTNADTEPDYVDTNSDPATGDCLTDTEEAYDIDQDGTPDTTPSGRDMDNDGLDDAFDKVVLGRLTGNTNAANTDVPTAFPNNYDPGTPELDWREEYIGFTESFTESSCTSSTAPFDLFTSLVQAAIPGGTWTGPAGGPPLTNGDRGTFTPGSNITGTYTYDLTVPGCLPRLATVDVVIGTLGNAGINGMETTCSSATTFTLLSRLGGTPDPGGEWFFNDPIAGSVQFGTNDQGDFNPATDPGGIYTYTVGTAGCQVSANVEVIIQPGADPGLNNAIRLCSTDGLTDLFSQLGGTPDMGGTWTGPGPTTNADRGTIDPATAIPGDYIYTISTSTCPIPATALVNVSVDLTPDVMIDSTVCATNRTTYDISFTANGTWNYSLTPNVGTVNVAAGTITGIPDGTDVDITATNPSNAACTTQVSVTAPDCSCPSVAPPVDITASGQDSSCFGDPNGLLEVSVAAGLTANWYDDNNQLVVAGSTSYTPVVDQPGTYIFSVEAEDMTINCTSGRINITYEIVDIPIIDLDVTGVLCLNEDGSVFQSGVNGLPEILSGLSPADFDFQWSFEGTPIPGEVGAELLTVLQAGTYALTYTDRVTGCSETSQVIVNSVRAIQPGDLTLSLSRGQFADENDLIADMPFAGNFEYSLDGGPFQSSNVFRNVPLGLREVVVREVNGCGEDISEIKVFGFPAFFTPNGDNNNDFWNVKIQGDDEIPPMEIFIFDRYGKLLRRQEPEDLGWDGSFNGQPLPSTDYWFTARLMDGTGIEYSGHFNLRR
ncbi:T9SS type B sorting domain-containing protein [Aquimarina sp. ERC-38]|uniref:T9SS type B sorting domain-containing protein n=1 Tax=Aquimarina sp. ERC-38 TaxID=2949996 RepID=UPI002245F8CC|nr:T9SS type B sorting domain-containing protein [Aquimarina sp. ERC-38]UZO81138.1 T9SS type B sorting domain-containing protein [Aquimarina sp. ERC-38]